MVTFELRFVLRETGERFRSSGRTSSHSLPACNLWRITGLRAPDACVLQENASCGQCQASRMSRISVGLASSCLSLKHARFGALNLGGEGRVRVYTKPWARSVAYGREEEANGGKSRSFAVDCGPSLQRGRRVSLGQSERSQQDLQGTVRTKPELGFSPRDEIVEERDDAFGGTNLLNAKELVEKLVKEDGFVKRFVKGAELDRESFTRVFDVAALRVPADECGSYVSKLKGHLLNWPRVKNVPRIEGDDGDAALKSLLWEDSEALDTPESLVESVRSALYPEESKNEGTRLVKKRRKFPALRKLTRGVDSDLLQAIKPRRTGQSQSKWEDAAVKVEVVEGCRSAQNHDNEPREATRILLLDERYNDKLKDELPQAVQVVLENPGSELVRCQLTLTYDYWPMEEILKGVLPMGMTIPTAFESVGHIAHLNLRNEHTPYRHTIAQIVLEKNKPRIRTVVNKTDVIHNKYRTMQLELLAGNSSLVTTVVEHGLSFRLDLASVYWNSRLATERQRLIDTFNENDIVCDMFAGVGPIAVVAAEKVKFVYANDLNPTATSYMQHNLSLNKLAYKAEVSNEDARQFVRNLLARNPPVLFSQVTMNLPLDAAEFLDVFVRAFSRDVWEGRALPQINVYGFSKAKNPEAEYSERIADILNEMPHPMYIHRVRLVAPGKYMLCASFRLPATVAFARSMPS